VGNAKDQVRKILDRLPEDASYEDIQYHIYIIQKVSKGLDEVAEGRVVDEEEADRRMDKWLGA